MSNAVEQSAEHVRINRLTGAPKKGVRVGVDGGYLGVSMSERLYRHKYVVCAWIDTYGTGTDC